MDPETFMWINQLDKMSTAEVLIFDEIGPLEVEQKQDGVNIRPH